MAGVGGGAYGVEAWMKSQGITGQSIRQEDRRRRKEGRYPGYSAWQELDSPFNREVAGPWQGVRAANDAANAAPAPFQDSAPMYSLDDFMASSNSYMTSYRNNIAASRKQIEEQFRLAFSDATTRGDVSQGVVNQLPGKYDAIYAGASAQIDKEGAASLAQQQAHGLQSFEGAGTGSASQKTAMTANFAAAKADVPLLAAGVTSIINRQKGALGQAKFERQGDLDRQAAEMEVNYQKEQGLAKRDYMMALQSHQWQLDDRNFAAQSDARNAAAARSDEDRIWNRDRAGAREDQLWAQNQANDQQKTEQHDLDLARLHDFANSNSSVDRANAMQAAHPANYERRKEGTLVQEAINSIGKAPGRSRWASIGGAFGFGVSKGIGFGAPQTPTKASVIAQLEKDGHYREAAIVRKIA